MEHLSSLDASFLQAEDSDPHISLAIGGVSILAGPTPGYDGLVAAFATRVRKVPRCTQVLHTHPFDLGSPEWVDDPDFDVAHHVHHVALPQPGDDAELFSMIATLMERRLDRERPLWECWVIEGLTGDRWAMLIKLHHCIAATQMLASFTDEGTGETFATDIHGSQQATPARLARPSLNPLTWMTDAWKTSVAAANSAAHAAAGAAELTAALVGAGPKSSLSGPVSSMRRYSAARVRLADMIEVCHAFDVTLNDVALAAISDSYRGLLVNRGEAPQWNSLRTLLPVSVRAVAAFSKPDNRVSAMLPLLPVDEPDPIERLRKVHDRLSKAKDSGQPEGASAFMSATNNIPFALSAWAIRLLTRLPQHGVVALATNVPGPRRKQHVLDREVLELLPIAPIALHLRTAIGMLSYADSFVFGITADYDGAPDLDQLASGIERGVAHLAKISRARRRRRVRRVSATANA